MHCVLAIFYKDIYFSKYLEKLMECFLLLELVPPHHPLLANAYNAAICHTTQRAKRP
jgi:hypothetical protein